MKAVPLVGAYIPVNTLIVVDLPAPLCPSNAVICPSKKFRVKLLTAVFPLNFLDKSFNEIPIGK